MPSPAARPPVRRWFATCGASSPAITRACVNFTPALRLKDIEYALRLARKLGRRRAFGEVAAEVYRRLCERGYARDNESRIIDCALRSRS